MLKLLSMLRPYRTLVFFVLLFVFLQSLSDLYLPTLLSDIVNKGVIEGNNPYIWRVGGFMLLIALGGGICSIGASYLSAKSAGGFGQDLRSRMFSHVENYSLKEFDKIGTASLITRTTNDITQVQQVLMMMMRVMVMAPMMCFGGIVMSLYKDAHLSLIIIAIVPLLALIIFGIVSRGVPLFKAMQLKIDKLNLVLRENLTGIRVIRPFNRTKHEQERFNDANMDLTNTAIKVNRIMATLMPIMMLVMNFASLFIVWFGGQRIVSGNMAIGDLLAFIQYAWQIMFALIFASMMFVMIPRASASSARINEVLNTVPDIRDPAVSDLEDASTSNDTNDSTAHIAQPRTFAVLDAFARGTLAFNNVSFHYPGAEVPALSNITFTASPGEVTAIIGGTGSGKSTLINLIPRFYDVTDGSITIGGVDVREFSQEELRAGIGLVPQKAMLFTGSITDNIRFGKPDATDEEIRHAAVVAQAIDFVSDMKEGFDSIISQGGSNVSGGQKQRLAIARALIRRPSIYLFDDSFSALDFKTDAKLREALRSETADAAVLIVAQRVSTVIDADRIIVLEDGQIAAIGTHRELLQSSTVYHEIVSSQLSEEEIA